MTKTTILGLSLFCFSGLFVSCLQQQDQTVAVNAAISNYAITSTTPVNGMVGVPTGSPIVIGFSNAANRATVEQSISIFKGKYNLAANPKEVKPKLKLASFCDGGWRVSNSTTTPISFTWKVETPLEQGVGVVLANSDATFYTTTGKKQLKLIVGKEDQADAKNSTTPCPAKNFGFAWNTGSTNISVQPIALLEKTTDYTVVVSTGAKNSAGAVLASPTISGFTTGTEADDLNKYLDPSIIGDDRDQMRQVLSMIAPDGRADVTYLNVAAKTVFGSSDRARNSGEFLTPLGDNLYQSSDGTAMAFPFTDTGTVVTQSLGTQAIANPCVRQSGLGEKSGPYYRICHNPGTIATKVNWMRTKVYLPEGQNEADINANIGKEAGGYFDTAKFPGTSTSVNIVSGPFIYAGGWSSTTSVIDAGFQLSTGATPSGAGGNGGWALFVAANKTVFTSGKDKRVTTQISGSNVYNFSGGNWVTLTFFNLDNLLVLAVKGKSVSGADQYKILVARLPNGSGWTANGIGSWFKMMTTIGQSRKNPSGVVVFDPNKKYASLAQKLISTGYNKNVRFANLESGYIPTNAYWSSVIPDAATKNWISTDLTVEPDPTNSSVRRPWTNVVINEFPNDTQSATEFNIDKERTGIFADVIKLGPNEFNANLTCISIDLRAAPAPGIKQDKIPSNNKIDKKDPPACTPPGAALRVQTQGITTISTQTMPTLELDGTPGKLTTETFYLNNFLGEDDSILGYRFGNTGEYADTTPALVARRVRATHLCGDGGGTCIYTQPKIGQATFSPSVPIPSKLRNPRNPRLDEAPDSLEFKLQATCPLPIEQKRVYKTSFDMVYTTGEIDSMDTPYYPDDDKPQQYVVTVPVKLNCRLPIVDASDYAYPAPMWPHVYENEGSDAWSWGMYSRGTYQYTSPNFTNSFTLPLAHNALVKVQSGLNVVASDGNFVLGKDGVISSWQNRVVQTVSAGVLGGQEDIFQDYLSPVQTNIPATTDGSIRKIVALSKNIVAMSDGTAWDLGDSYVGSANQIFEQVIDPLTQQQKMQPVTGVYGVSSYAGVRQDGSVTTWLSCSYVPDGTGSVPVHYIPITNYDPKNAKLVPGLSDIVAVASGGVEFENSTDEQILALKKDGSLWLVTKWTPDSCGSGVPQLIGNCQFTSIEINFGAAIGLCTNGTVFTWGSNVAGDFGNAPNTPRFFQYPTLVSGMSGMVGVSLGRAEILGLRSDGSVMITGGVWDDLCANACQPDISYLLPTPTGLVVH